MLDEYLIGTSTRNSPEADVPVVLKKEIELRLGGAANVALNLKNLEINPYLVSVVGDDEAGKKMKSLLDETKISSELIVDNTRPTTIKQRIIDESYKQFLRIDTESTDDLNVITETEIRDRLAELIKNKNIDGIVLQDYNKGVITEFIIKVVHDLALQNELPIFVDPKHKNFKLLASRCTLFKPNIKELKHHLDAQIEMDSVMILSALSKIDELDADMVFVTLGEKGIFYHHKLTGSHGIIPGIKVDKADVSGAGDSVLSALIWAYYNNGIALDMAKIANMAGAKVCKLQGVSSIHLHELSELSKMDN